MSSSVWTKETQDYAMQLSSSVDKLTVAPSLPVPKNSTENVTTKGSNNNNNIKIIRQKMLTLKVTEKAEKKRKKNNNIQETEQTRIMQLQ